ncbi:hypothetical protein JYK00_07220 [Thermosipho ferrireducens]|uniref:Uncharacterized protein n=1 Tax=Thermosipho ferrireducens TaxID=2571116 RepID=A0ABX7S7D0_9BACT|nr:WD40 repeat domain-containing protein [Thermosipho ferrireducens]QTA37517.1 hypothetical protein JYK00_07220 [Thermosipho ferrireducens]
MKKLCVIFFLFLIISNFYASFSFNFAGHSGAIWDIKIYNGEVFTAGADGAVNIWKFGSDILLRTIYSNSSWTRAVEITNDYIITGGYKPDNSVKIFSKKEGKLVNTFSDHKGSIFTLATDGLLLASGGSDNTVVIRNLSTNGIVAKYHAHSRWVRDLKFYKNYLISGGDDGKIIFFDLNTLKIDKVIELSEKVIKILTVSDVVYAVTAKGFVYEISPRLKKVYFQENITAAFINSSNRLIYLGDNTGMLYILSTDFRLLERLKILRASITSISGFKEIIYVGGSDGKIKMYNLKTNGINSLLTGTFQIKRMFYKENLLYVVMSSGKLIVYNVLNGLILKRAGFDEVSNLDISDSVFYSDINGRVYKFGDRNIEIFQTENEVTLLKSVKGKLIVGTYKYLFIINEESSEIENYFESEGSWFNSFYYNGKYFFFGTTAGEIFVLSENFDLIWTEKISNSLIVGFTGYNELFVITFEGKIFEMNFSQRLFKITKSFDENVLCETFFDGKIVLGTKRGFYILENETYKFIKTEAMVVALSHGDKKLFVGLANGTVGVYDINYNLSQILREGENKILAVDVSSKGEYVVTGGADNKVKLWRIEGNKFKLEKTMAGHDDWVRSVIFVKDKYIVSGSADNTIKIWDKNSGRLVKTLSEHNGYVWALAHKNGILYSGGWDNKIIARNFESGQILFEVKTNSAVTDIVIWKNFLFASEVNGDIARVNITTGEVSVSNVSSSTIWDIDIYKNFIVFGDEKGKVFVYSVNDFKRILVINAHKATVFTVKIFQNGIITASVDNTLKIFNFEGKLIKTYKRFTQAVLSIAVDPERNAIITSGGLTPTLFQLP